MHETQQDLERLQALLDASRAAAGPHLRSIHTDDRWLTASELADLLPGVNVLALATVTAAGEPRVAPVDGPLFQGAFWVGSSPDSVRFRHLRVRPAVSATHARGEELAVTVHGRAYEVDLGSSDHQGFVRILRDLYPNWEDWAAGSAYARIDAERMYTFADRPALGLP